MDGSGARWAGGLFTGVEWGTILTLSVAAVPNSATAYLWSQYPGTSGVSIVIASDGNYQPVIRPGNNLDAVPTTARDTPGLAGSYVWSPNVALGTQGSTPSTTRRAPCTPTTKRPRP